MTKVELKKFSISVLVLSLISTYGWADGTDGNLKEIPDNLVLLESTNRPQYVIIVEKDTQKLFLYSYNGSYKKISSVNCSTGKAPGAKLKSGDKKTPEGIYFFTNEYNKNDLSPTYGTRAFPIDYPNLLDLMNGLSGNAIWLHGINKPLKARNSNGCIVLKNSDIDMIAKLIILNRTPLIIVKKITYSSVDSINGIKDAVLSFLLSWNAALKTGTYQNCLKFYDRGYTPDISWWSDWNRAKTSLSTFHDNFFLELKNLLILKHNKTYVVLFDQIVKIADRSLFVGTMKLFLIKSKDRIKIIAGKYQVLPKIQTSCKPDFKLVSVLRNLKITAGGLYEK